MGVIGNLVVSLVVKASALDHHMGLARTQGDVFTPKHQADRTVSSGRNFKWPKGFDDGALGQHVIKGNGVTKLRRGIQSRVLGSSRLTFAISARVTPCSAM